MARVNLRDLAKRLASRDDLGRSEASLQSDVRTLLLAGDLNLEAGHLLVPDLETPAGAGRRIDVEVGFTVIETKRDLRKAGVRADAEHQLGSYVKHRQDTTRQRYVGILTDGVEWRLYHLRPLGELEEVSDFQLGATSPDPDGLLLWLEGVMATAQDVVPSPLEIARRLGAGSPTHQLELAQLAALWEIARDKRHVLVKRELWARLLTAALGTKFEDDDRLFIEHTYLVISAELIAHEVIGFNISDPNHSPAALLAGHLFAQAQVGGVVEEDFFDWVLDAEGGDQFVRTLARRLGRFAWQHVEHDILKILYESVIPAPQRHRLGEYYTPDWLAEHIVAEVVDDPLNQTVLDPACGSGTFLFHAVRRYVETAEAAAHSPGKATMEVATRITGVDLHPVAVTLARVTFLLAIGADRLTHPDRGAFSVPVYLGDSLLWRHDNTLFARGGVTIETSDHAELFARELHFPGRVLADAARFDQLVSVLADRATNRPRGSRVPEISTTFNQFAVHPDDRPALIATFQALCALVDEQRDHIWSYYARNVARPFWLTLEKNRVDRLVGNPPWLAYRFMPSPMQKAFRQRSQQRGLWTGGQVATQQDLSGYFVSRAVELYLRGGGRFGFVMPAAVLDRKQWSGFRAGSYSAPGAPVRIAFDEPWDLADVDPTPFPVPAAVIVGEHANDVAQPLPLSKQRWAGRLPTKNLRWDLAEPHLIRTEVAANEKTSASAYKERFSNGATIYPRVLTMVEEAPPGPLGAGAGRRSLRSARTNQEDPRWRNTKSLHENIEVGFVLRVYVGSCLLPYRLREPVEAVIPWTGKKLLDGDDANMDHYPGLASWWRRAEKLWDAGKGRSKLTLSEQLNFQNKLLKQFPPPQHRLLFPKSGMTLAAARLSDTHGIVENTVYWAACSSADEARYLAAIINSRPLLERIMPLQARGQFGRRHFDKVIFENVAIPLWDPDSEDHWALARLGQRSEEVAAAFDLPTVGFQRARALIRAELIRDGVAQAVDDAVETLLATLR